MTRTRTRLAAQAVTAVFALGALAGCSGLHPGVAAEVGDRTISGTRVDELAGDVCTTLKSDPRLLGDGYARSTLLQYVVQGFVMRSIAEQMAQEYGVSNTTGYASAVDQIRTQFASLDPDLLDQVLDTWSASDYFVDIVTEIGKQELVKGGTATPAAQDSTAKGIELAQAWEADHDIAIDPRFPDLTLTDTNFQRTADHTAFAVSEMAKQAAADQPDAAWVKSLPPAQRCG